MPARDAGIHTDTVKGEGIPLLDDVILNEYPDGRGIAAPLGLTFDVDGTAYMLVDWLYGSNPRLAELVTIDMDTGAVTIIASIDNHFCGSEIDACGNLYTVGSEAGGVYYSDTYGDRLCRIDKVTGAVTEIGPGTGLADVMDLAFDSEGTLWGTTQNKLYTIGTESGVATWVTDIYGVPPAPEGETNPMMVMSIMFDKHDVLYGTAIVGFWETNVTNAPIMRIDVDSGMATVLGMSKLAYNHGGDNFPSKVNVCHLEDDGSYTPKTISMSALDAHLAHGDMVPGAAGYSCDCP